ncbi:hypothetical protein JHK87_001497 [Glycine soja]|nr:hypothetical protein JHK87_001497 [Glycine soja]
MVGDQYLKPWIGGFGATTSTTTAENDSRYSGRSPNQEYLVPRLHVIVDNASQAHQPHCRHRPSIFARPASGISYKIFFTVCHSSSGKLLSFAANQSSTNLPSQNLPISPTLQRSITSTVASKVKMAFGLKSLGLASRKSPGFSSGQGKLKQPLTIDELMLN